MVPALQCIALKNVIPHPFSNKHYIPILLKLFMVFVKNKIRGANLEKMPTLGEHKKNLLS